MANNPDSGEHELRDVLIRERERFLKIAAMSPAGIFTFLIEPDGRVSMPFASAAFADIYGVTPEQVRTDAQPALDVIHPQDFPRVQQTLADSLASLTLWQQEYRVNNPVKGELWVEARSMPQREANGAVTWHGILLDVTARKRVEEQLRKSEEQFRLLAETIPQIVWEIDTEGRLQYVNQQFRKYLQRDPADIDPSKWARDIHPEDVPVALSSWQTLGSAGEPQSVDIRLRRFDGVYRWFTVRSAAVRNTSGEISHWVSTATDIDDLKQTQDALRDSEERLRVATAAGSIGIWDCDLLNARFRLDDIAVMITGLPAQGTLEWDTLLSGVHPDDRWRVDQSVKVALDPEGDGCYNVEIRRINPRSGVTRYVHNKGQAFFQEFDNRKRAVRFLGTMQDVTARRRAQDALETANYDLRQFAYAAAHDLQEPLRNMANGLSLLKEMLQRHPDQQELEMVGEGIDNAKRMHRMVKDLLAFTDVSDRMRSVESPIDANSVLQEVIGNLRSTIEEVHAEVRSDPLPVLWMEQTHLVQLLQNLIGNALKYRKLDRKPVINVSAARSGAEWVISIRDNGIGFDPIYAERIFGIFKRLHGAGEYAGTGIGLALCLRIVRLYGGRIWAEGRPGDGATFSFALPSEKQLLM